jgi:hypothetical protein
VIDWDAYRFDYPALTDEQHIALYDRVWQECPNQRSATVDLVRRFLEGQSGWSITEIGSWDGWLRSQVDTIRPWAMIEICKGAAAESLKLQGVSLWVPPSFRWWRGPMQTPGAGALIACHVIEHLSDADFTEMARAVFPSFHHVYLEAPLPQQGPCDWAGYEGSHVMKMGWDGVRKVMADLGFVEQWTEEGSVVWRRA